MSDELHFNPVREYERVKTENAKLFERGARLFDKTMELAIENAKLREERDMYRDLVGMMDHPDLNAQLSAENAKLRELAGRLYGSYLIEYPDAAEREFEGELRELGVEI